jgi:ubiquinone/menaquinone biosynthesis C-methylase UbiE
MTRGEPELTHKLDDEFYREKSWGAIPIRDAWDLPSLKIRHAMEVLRRRSRADASLLELGCGSGRILSSVHARDPELRLTGLDLSASQIDLARRSHPAIEFVHGDGEALPFADGSFDYVVFFDYLEHIENPPASLAEMYRVLAPAGQLHFVCPAEAQGIYWLSRKITGRHFKEQTAGHIQQFSRRGLERLVAAAGFRTTELRYSYHLVGSLMDYSLFTLMLHPRIYRTYWTSNAYYAQSEEQSKGGIFNALLRAGNAIAYLESRLCSRIRFGATAVHVTARKSA